LKARGAVRSLHPDDRERVLPVRKAAIEAGRPYEIECRRRRADGVYRWFCLRAFPLRDAQGRVALWYRLQIDIEEQKKAERELQLTIDSIPTLVATYRPDGSRFFVNQTWRDYSGLSPETAAEAERIGFIHPDDAARVNPERQKSFATGVPFQAEVRLRRADGEYRWYLVHRVAARDESGTIVKWYSVGADIEDRKRAEEALRESEQRFRDYAETASDWFWEHGPDHRVIRISEHVGDIGFSPSSLAGLSRWDVATDTEAEPEKWRMHRATIDARRPFRDFVYTVDGGGSPIYVRTSGKPVHDAGGNFLGYRGTGTNITATIRVEHAEEALREAKAELAHVTRITALGELTASIAHEVNQPLAAVIANAEACLRWLDRETPDLAAARRSAEWVISDGTRASEVVRRVRALANKSDIEKVPLDLNTAVRDVVALVQREVSDQRVSLRTELEPGLPVILGDRVQLQQVIINLVMNGIEAMQQVTDRPREMVIRSRQSEARQAIVSVTDCGVGISAENANRLFNAFFTTKSCGLGMGLSICRSIVEAHGGRLSVSGNEGPGATFQFVLPLHEEDA
jgi:PAS domain S-box-containing protein